VSETIVPAYGRAEQLAADPRVVREALRAYFAVADRWQLKTDEGRRLLGAPSESTYFTWKKRGVDSISPDTLLRISYVLSIAAFLRRLFGGAPERADEWMRRPNSGPLTRGRSALEFVLDGGVVALDELHGFLQSDTGSGAPVTIESAVRTSAQA
jgi:hypothetical protein